MSFRIKKLKKLHCFLWSCSREWGLDTQSPLSLSLDCQMASKGLAEELRLWYDTFDTETRSSLIYVDVSEYREGFINVSTKYRVEVRRDPPIVWTQITRVVLEVWRAQTAFTTHLLSHSRTSQFWSHLQSTTTFLITLTIVASKRGDSLGHTDLLLDRQMFGSQAWGRRDRAILQRKKQRQRDLKSECL